ncbi:MAG: alginate lyase family protein [Planctomycetaceae bacterium]|nr:alginate lyase family protein [Planctomycetaceae bacterium]
MSLLKTIQKARKASAREIRCRLRAVLRQRVERRLAARGRNGSPLAGHGRQLLESCSSLLAGAKPSELQRLVEAHPAHHLGFAAHAEAKGAAIIGGSWEMLGCEFDVSGAIDWHRDPRTGHQFPCVFYADVPRHQAADDGIDVKYVWELGRQQFVAELARSWQFTRDERFARQAQRLISSWIEQNPIYDGVHWTSGLEVAVRAISWIWTLAALADWSGWREGDLDRIAASLVDHATYLEHHFSYFSSPYNHLVGEATGLYLIAQALRHLPTAGGWRDKARDVLEEHGPKQFDRDGFCVEQATGYHYFTLGFLSLAIVAARQNRTPLTRCERSAHQAFRTGILFQQPNGRWPAIGDVDSARAIPVHHEDFWDFNSLCSLGAVLFDDPQLKRPGMACGEELYWLLGCDGIDHWDALKTTSADHFTCLPDAGYVVARQGGDWLCFDSGPIAHGLHADATPSTAHGHLDTLQVLYAHAGAPVLIDPGMPFYFGERDWVRHFRDAAAHNTLAVEGVSFARDAGRLAWSHATTPAPIEGREIDGLWFARGTAKWREGVVVERNVLVWPGEGLWIADRIRSTSPRRVEWCWQLPAAKIVQLESIDPAAYRIVGTATDMAFRSAGPALVTVMTQGKVGSPVGWNCDGYGSRSPGVAVNVSQSDATDALLLSEFKTSTCDVSVVMDGRSVSHGNNARRGPSADGEWTDVSPFADDIVWRMRRRIVAEASELNGHWCAATTSLHTSTQSP